MPRCKLGPRDARLPVLDKVHIDDRLVAQGLLEKISLAHNCLTPRPHSLPYTATKFALQGMTHQLTMDGRKYGVVSSIIHPGATLNSFSTRRGPTKPGPGATADDYVMAPEDVAKIVVLMCGPAAGSNPTRRRSCPTRCARSSGVARRETLRLFPNCMRDLNERSKLGPLPRFAERIPGDSARKTALRTNREPVEIDVPRRILHAALQRIGTLKLRSLAADDPQHDALVFRHETQRREVAGTRRIVFEQKMVCVRAREEALGDNLVSAFRQIVALEIATAHVDSNTGLGRTRRDAGVEGIDVAVDQRLRIAARARHLRADGRIAEERDRNLIDLYVAAARRDEVSDLLLEYRHQIGEEAIDVGIRAVGGKILQPQKVHS